MKYGYIRVSTTAQAKDGNSMESQEKQLRDAGAEIIRKDVFTGKRIDRPELMKLLSEVTEGDTIMVTKLDRFARSIGKASELITDLIDRGIRIEVLNIGVLDNSSVSTLFRNMLLSFAQFERDMIIERTLEGKSIARQNPGYHEGRPRKFSKIRLEHAMNLLESRSYRQVESETGISVSTLKRYKRQKQLGEMANE